MSSLYRFQLQVKRFREIGLNIAKGIISFGIPKKFVIGEIICTTKSNSPELLNTPIATNNPIRVGNILNTISIPSFAPSTNISNTFIRSLKPQYNIRKIVRDIDNKAFVFINETKYVFNGYYGVKKED